jgi:hypothetical protein
MAEGLPQPDHRSRAWLARCGLIAVIAVCAYLFNTTGRFDAIDVNDTPGYRPFSFASKDDVLTSIRTPGYPLFLRGVELISTDPRAVPIAQFALFAASVLILFEALRCLTGRIWIPWLAAASLMSTNMLAGYVNTVATETLSAAVSILCGALILFWSHSQRWWLLLAIMVATSAAWLIRPNGVFLIPWIPYIGAWLVAWKTRHAPNTSTRPHVRPGVAFAQLSLTVIVPLAVWVGVRVASYGHWGVACFDGYNMIGLAGQFGTPETAQSLSPEQQQVIDAALANRERRFQNGGSFLNEPPLHYLRMEFNHDDTIWTEYVPPTRKLVGDSPLEINAFLSSLSRSIIARQPVDYATWLGKAARQAVRKVFYDLFQHPVSLSLLLASVVLFLTAPVRASAPADAMSPSALVRLMAVFSISYAVLNIVCTIPFVPPRERMTDAAALWAPALLAIWLGSLLERRFARRLPPSGGL